MASRPVRWQELIKEGEGYSGPYRPGYSAGNVPAQEPMSVPVSEAAGKITPSGDTSGLYAIYNRKNPYSSEVDRYSQMAGRDMGGRLGQLPGIAATLMAGRAASKSQAFEEERAKKVDAILVRKEAWDKIKNDEEAQKRDLKIYEERIGPQVHQAYVKKYSETKDPQVAGKFAASVSNDLSAKEKLAVPYMENYTAWKDGEIAPVWRVSDKSVRQGKIDKNGNLGVMNDKGEMVPTDSGDMLFDTYYKMQEAKAKEQKLGAQNLKDYDLASISSQLNSLRQLKSNMVDLSPEENAQYEALNSEFNRRTGVKVSAPPAPVSEVTQPPAAPKAQAPWVSGSGNSASPVAAQPQPLKDANGREIYKGPDGKFYYR